MEILLSTLEDLSKYNPARLRAHAARTHVLEIARNFAQMGHSVNVLCCGGETEPSKLHRNVTGIKIGLPRGYPLLTFLNKKLQRHHLRKTLSQLIDGMRIDVVYERDNAFNMATEVGKERGIPTFLEVNGIAPLEAKMHGADPQTVARIQKQTLEKLRAPDKIMAVTEDIKEYFVQLGILKEKFLVTPNGVNTEIFRPMNTMECRKILGLPDSPVIMFVGSFRVYQGLEYAIRAIPLVLEHFPNAKLVIVGDSEVKDGFKFRPTRQDLEVIGAKLGVLEHLIFTGFVPYEQIVLYINASDVCIAPVMPVSRGLAGRSSIKLFEYMACGKPVVISATRDTNEMARKGAGILIAKPADPEDLAQKIVTLIRDSERRRIMGERALRFVRNNHTWRIVSQRILREMKKIVEGKAPTFESMEMSEKS